MSWRGWWAPALVVLTSAVLAAPTALDPHSTFAHGTYLLGTALLALCTLAGALAARGAGRTVWFLVAGTMSCWLAGDALQYQLVAVGEYDRRVGAPDVLWLLSYVFLAGAVVLIVRSRGLSRQALNGVVLDAVVAAAAAGAVVWQVVVEPGLREGSSWVVLVVGSLYPLADVGVFALALTLLMIPGRRVAPGVLLLVFLGLTLPFDLVNAVAPLLSTGFDVARLDAAFLVVNGCLAAAAVHRDRDELVALAPLDGEHRMPRWRVVLLGAALMTVILTGTVTSSRLIDLAPSLVAALVVSLAVVLRFYAAVRDQEAAHAVLQHQAHHDQLTGLANRALLRKHLVAAVHDRTGPVLVFVDLDGFKAVNDVHGHRGGDAVLRAVARRLQGVVRPGDTVARLGGDEFVLLCGDVPPDAVADLGHRVLDVVRRPIQLGAATVSVGASVGVLTVARTDDAAPGATEPAEQIADEALRAADEAMYRAKRAGGGVVSATSRGLDATTTERWAPLPVPA